ncbi:hypothetical protein BCR37DRAFT_379270 [Protomyces lactucae-debilis]|uniref:Uncharacterized protein n=1 Tax=Protomyces lactucae-debilis TaxID=2754530 RepID=A0A1Y2FH26_PROLT|nr:uncharacterized protein BCR37DRAFT_379270 [Protomyces lactucae-debilis]ORY83251.1 hypothetical protein BCR37DRAFT_379270 [Protomyces lactucae-debilis]
MRMFKNGEQALAVLLLSMDYAPHVHAGKCQKFLVKYPFPGGDNGKLHDWGFSIAKKDSCYVLVDDELKDKASITSLLPFKPCSAILSEEYYCWISFSMPSNVQIVPKLALSPLEGDNNLQIFHYCSTQFNKESPVLKLPMDDNLREGIWSYAQWIADHQLDKKDHDKLWHNTQGNIWGNVLCAYHKTKVKDPWLHFACNLLACPKE